MKTDMAKTSHNLAAPGADAIIDSATGMTMPPLKKEKPKRKNSEKRKEKSRKAARERRSQESKIFDEIEEILPVAPKILDHLDKASLVRVAINFLKIRSIVDPFKQTISDSADTLDIGDNSFSNTLNGFLFVLSKDGDLIYLSENVERHLGLTHVELMGQSIYDFSHPCDHDDIKAFLDPLVNSFNTSKMLPKPRERAKKPLHQALSEPSGPFFIRMKCTLTSKGRNVNLKSANYKVIKCTGRMIDLETASPEQAEMIGENFRHYMIVIGELIQQPSRNELAFKTDIFISKHTPDMKFIYVDESVQNFFGYNSADLVGTSFYQYFDGNDFSLLSKFFKTLFAKGQCDFGHYKFLVKTGGYRWISTQATLINEPNSNQPQSIILFNRVISGVENAHLLTSHVQSVSSVVETPIAVKPLQPSANALVTSPPVIVSSTASVIKSKSVVFKTSPTPVLAEIKQNVPVVASQSVELGAKPGDPLSQLCRGPASSTEKCISSTAAVLAPKTADMESGFLMFDDKGMTVLTDADDLTHLAPAAGDLCVPMLTDMDFNDFNINLFNDDFSFNVTSNNLSSDDDWLNNLSSLDHDKLKLDALDGLPEMKNCFDSQFPLSNDPFLSFSTSNDDLLMSGSPTTRSDCSLSIDSYATSSSNSPTNSLSPSLQFSPQSVSCDDVNSKLCDNLELEDKDLEMRAPFIPIDDDYCLLDDFSSNDNIDDIFDWISNDGSMTSANGLANTKQLQSDLKVALNNKTNKNSGKSVNKGSACLEALLQNDDLLGNLKNKVFSSNQLLSNKPIMNSASQPRQATAVPAPVVQNVMLGQCSPMPATCNAHSATLKRKNSNILIYTTMGSGEKKIKNLVLTADQGPCAKLPNTDKVHHYVLTKNHQLIPTGQPQFKIPKRMPANDSLSCGIGYELTANLSAKENMFPKKSRIEPERPFSSNSVLLNLLVNGADVSNGYELGHGCYQQQKPESHSITTASVSTQANMLSAANCLTMLESQ